MAESPSSSTEVSSGDSRNLSRDRPEKPFKFGGRWWKHDWARIAPRLGKATDGQLATEIGADVREVQRMRSRLGIPAYDRVKKAERFMGKVPDRRIAAHFGLNCRTVGLRRRALGIPRCDVARANAEALLRDYVRKLREE